MRRSQKFAATALAGTLLATALGAAGAAAETATSDTGTTAGTGDTTTDVQLTVAAGALEITAPDDTTRIDLGSVDASALGSVYSTTASTTPGSGSFGGMSVADNRGSLVSSWTVTAWGTNLTTGGGTEPETIEAADVAYTAISTSLDDGLGTLTPGAGTLDSTTPATMVYVGSGLTGGVNAASWQPQLTFTFDQNLVAGTYIGSIYHDLT